MLVTSDKRPSFHIICLLPLPPPLSSCCLGHFFFAHFGRLMRTCYPTQFFRGRRRGKRRREARGAQQLILTALLKGGRNDDMGPEGSLSFQAKEAARRKAIRYSHSKCIGRRRRRTLQYTRRRDNPALLIAKVTDCAHCLSDIFAKTMNRAIG